MWGGNTSYSAQVKGSLSSVIGSFHAVIGATGEKDLQAGNEHYSLQLNTNYFSSALCDNPMCYAIQQYIYDSPGNVYIQYWLVNHGSTCPSKTLAGNGWTYAAKNPAQPTASPGCVINGNQTSVTPAQPITTLAGLQLTGNNSPGAHSILLEISGDTLKGGQDDGDFLGIGTQWNIAEFNVFGAGNSSTAIITPNPGTTIVVRTSVDDGTRDAPTCSSTGFTNEQNSLTVTTASPCCPIGGSSPRIEVTQSNTPGAKSPCDCPRGARWDSDDGKCIAPKPACTSSTDCSGELSIACTGANVFVSFTGNCWAPDKEPTACVASCKGDPCTVKAGGNVLWIGSVTTPNVAQVCAKIGDIFSCYSVSAKVPSTTCLGGGDNEVDPCFSGLGSNEMWCPRVNRCVPPGQCLYQRPTL